MNISIDREIQNKLPGFSLGVIEYSNCVISPIPKMLKGKVNLYVADLRLEYGTEGLTRIPGIKQWRQAFKEIGIDPSKYRPSSEALLRRTLQEKPMYWINSAVDINNFLSMKYAMPYGIYNADKIVGNVNLRVGKEEDRYLGLNGRETSLEGKLILADDQSAFGSPIVDSVRTSITEDATNILQIIFIYPQYSENERMNLLNDTASLFTHIHGGMVVTKDIV